MTTLRRDLVAWDRAHLWHPFTQMQDWLAEAPLIIERGEGNYLIDTEGRRYFDGVSSLWCNVHGHRHPALDAALRAQVDRIAHSTLLGLANVPSIELAKALVEIAPAGLQRVFYSDAGATAVEIALKIAVQYWQLRGEPRRLLVASLTEAYHGDTLGAVSVGYSETFHHFFRPLLFPAIKLDPPHVFRWQRGMEPEQALAAAIEQAEAGLVERREELAAIIVEPMMQGAAGMWSQPPEYVRALRDLATRTGALLICDEVATGFGRTGRMFAVEHAGVRPDILCVGKGITGGYLPLAATLTTEEIFNAFLAPYADFRAFFHGHTYTGNALACAVALASLELFTRENIVERVQALARRMGHLLAERIAPLSHVGDIRQVGLMVGIELVRERRGRVAYTAADQIGARVCREARKHGVLLRPLGPVIILMPPLSSTGDEIDHLVGVVASSIRSIAGE